MVLLKSDGVSCLQRGKLTERFVGPFMVKEEHEGTVYKLQLPLEWRCHDVFHASSLKLWKKVDDQPAVAVPGSVAIVPVVTPVVIAAPLLIQGCVKSGKKCYKTGLTVAKECGFSKRCHLVAHAEGGPLWRCRKWSDHMMKSDAVVAPVVQPSGGLGVVLDDLPMVPPVVVQQPVVSPMQTPMQTPMSTPGQGVATPGVSVTMEGDDDELELADVQLSVHESDGVMEVAEQEMADDDSEKTEDGAGGVSVYAGPSSKRERGDNPIHHPLHR